MLPDECLLFIKDLIHLRIYALTSGEQDQQYIASKSLSKVKKGIPIQICCYLLTPCSSSFISCSVTFGVLSARRRQWTLSSGTRYSSTSLSGRPRAWPCFDVEGTTSSRMEPLRVFSCIRHYNDKGRNNQCYSSNSVKKNK